MSTTWYGERACVDEFVFQRAPELAAKGTQSTNRYMAFWAETVEVKGTFPVIRKKGGGWKRNRGFFWRFALRKQFIRILWHIFLKSHIKVRYLEEILNLRTRYLNVLWLNSRQVLNHRVNYFFTRFWGCAFFSMDHPIATALRGKYMHLDQRFKVPETHPMVHATVKTATFPGSKFSTKQLILILMGHKTWSGRSLPLHGCPNTPAANIILRIQKENIQLKVSRPSVSLDKWHQMTNH